MSFSPKLLLPVLLSGGVILSGASFAQEAPTFSVDTSDGLVIDGEVIASKELLDAARAEGSFVLYTSVGEDQERWFAEQFKAHTGVDTSIIRLTPSRMGERILSELGADSLSADVVKVSDPPMVTAMEEAGLYHPYRVPAHELLDDNAIASPDDHYYRVSLSFYTIGYNSQLVTGDDIPTSWMDLLDPKWNERLGLVSVSTGGSSRALARFHRSQFGDEYLEGLAAQQPRIFDSASTLLSSIARGEALVGVVIPARVNVAVEEGAPVNFVIPEEGVSGWDFFIGLSDEKSAAGQLYMNWMMSRVGQSLITGVGDYSSRADVAPPVIMGTALPPLSSVFRSSMEDAVTYQEEDETTWFSIMN